MDPIYSPEAAAKALLPMLEASQYTVFFGGAGVSTASNLPDFRGRDGLYQRNARVEEILSSSFFQQQPEAFYDFYREFFMLRDIHPNPAHELLAQLEERGLLASVITQNIDGLHQAAGAKRVIEVHGTTLSFSCTRCHRQYELGRVIELEHVPHCPDCKGLLRPDIVLYGEALPEEAVRQALYEISRAELLIVGGTSLTVYPAAAFINYQRAGGRIVLINQGAVSCSRRLDLVIDCPIAEVCLALRRLMVL